jgi:hypothetical protein
MTAGDDAPDTPAAAGASTSDVSWKRLFADSLLDKGSKGGDVFVDVQEALAGKTVGVYFSAHWCVGVGCVRWYACDEMAVRLIQRQPIGPGSVECNQQQHVCLRTSSDNAQHSRGLGWWPGRDWGCQRGAGFSAPNEHPLTAHTAGARRAASSRRCCPTSTPSSKRYLRPFCKHSRGAVSFTWRASVFSA